MNRLGTRFETLGWAIFAATLLWAPIPYASNRPWAWSLLALLLGLAALCVALAATPGQPPRPLPLVVIAAGLLVAAAPLWGWLQSTSGLLPAPWQHPLWAEVRASGLEVEPRIAISSEGPRDNSMRLVSYLAAFLLAFHFGRDRRSARRIFLLVLAITAAEALYGLFSHFAGIETIFWEATPKVYAGTVTGTFVNRNNFATYLNIGILIGLGFLLRDLLRATGDEELRRRLARILDDIAGRRGLLLFALLILLSASLLTGSRGGFLSLAAALMGFLLLGLLATRPSPRMAAAIILFFALFTGLALYVSGAFVLERLMQVEATGGNRTAAYALALDLIRARPLFGHGYGSFEQLFMLNDDERFSGLIWDKAHNTYLEHAAELGLPAALALYAGMLLLFLYLLSGIFRRRRDQIYPLVATAATILVAVHALVDFSLQIPAVAVTYAAVLGVGVAQARSPRRDRRRLRDRNLQEL